MKYSAVILAAAASFVAAQDPTAYFPSCALPGLQTGIAATSCGATDYACQCTSANQATIQGAAASAIIAACGSDVAVNEVIPAAAKFCAAVAAGGSGSSTTAAATTSAAATTAASTTKASSTAASTTKASSTLTTTKASTGTAAPSHSGNGTAPTSTSVPVTAGAALAGSVGTLAMAVLGALAAF